MELQYEPMEKERMAFVIKIFKLEIIIGSRKKVKKELPIQVDFNSSFFANIIDRISNWVKSFFIEKEEVVVEDECRDEEECKDEESL